MLNDDAKKVADLAKELYEAKLRGDLEASHHGQYVCIEPQSGDFFLGRTFDQAVNQAIDRHPDRLTHTLRIGHGAALHLGVIAT